MKLFKKIMAVVMAVAMLTACGGSGGGGGTGGGGTPVAPSTFSSTKTYKLGQSGKGKSLYTEYWVEGDADNKDLLYKSGCKDENSYVEIYRQNKLQDIIVQSQSGRKNYRVLWKGHPEYDTWTSIATEGGADIPEGKNIYFDTAEVVRAMGGDATVSYIVSGIDQLKESDVVTSTGTYRGYYAEIFTFKSDPQKSVTYAYDENDELKATVGVDHEKTTAIFYNKYEFDSAMFQSEKLNIASYNAIDITDAYIRGWNKLINGQK